MKKVDKSYKRQIDNKLPIFDINLLLKPSLNKSSNLIVLNDDSEIEEEYKIDNRSVDRRLSAMYKDQSNDCKILTLNPFHVKKVRNIKYA